MSEKRPKEAKTFYVVYAGLIALAAALVLTPLTRLSMLALRGYLVIAGGLVVLRIVELAGG